VGLKKGSKKREKKMRGRGKRIAKEEERRRLEKKETLFV